MSRWWMSIVGVLIVIIVIIAFWYFHIIHSTQTISASHKLSARSDVAGYHLSLPNPQRFEQYLTSQGVFQSNVVLLDTQKVTVQKFAFVLTPQKQPDIFYASKTEGSYIAFGQVYNQPTQTMTIYLYVSPAYFSRQKDLTSASLDINSYLIAYLDSLVHGKQDPAHQAQIESTAMQMVEKDGLFLNFSK